MPCYSFHTRSQISSQTPTRVMSSRLKSTPKEVLSANSCHPASVFLHLETHYQKHCSKYRRSRNRLSVRKNRSCKLAKKRSNQRKRAHSSSKFKKSSKKWKILKKLRKSKLHPSNSQEHRRRHSAQSKRRSRTSSRVSWSEQSRPRKLKGSRSKFRRKDSHSKRLNHRRFRSWTWNLRARIPDSLSYW